MFVSAAGSGTSRMPWVTVVAALVGPMLLTAGAHLLDPEAARRARVEALVSSVDALRASLLPTARSGSIASCGSEDEARAAIADPTKVWHEAACWAGLPVTPASDYALWVVGGGDDFAIHGIADLDGDGEMIEFVATRAHAAEPWTGPGVL